MFEIHSLKFPSLVIVIHPDWLIGWNFQLRVSDNLHTPRKFADDTNKTLAAKTIADLKLAVSSELNNLTCWLRANRLSLNVAKTELMIIGSRQRLNVQCEETDISIASSVIGALKCVRPFISTDVVIQIYNALILPLFDYCSSVWDCMSGYLSDKLQKLQNRAATGITF